MKKYKILLQGNNFLLKLDGNKNIFGFYTTRYVEAENLKDAENIAIELIRNDHELRQSVLNKKNDPPIIFVDEIDELENFKGVKTPGKGYSFFLENQKE